MVQCYERGLKPWDMYKVVAKKYGHSIGHQAMNGWHYHMNRQPNSQQLRERRRKNRKPRPPFPARALADWLFGLVGRKK